MLDEAEHTPLTSKLSFYFEEASPPYKTLDDRLVKLLLERDTLLITYTDEFPQVRAIKGQIHENIESMKSHLRSQQRNLTSNMKIYRQQLAEMNDKFKRLPEKALELTRLDRDVTIGKEVYTLLEKRYQEALIAEAEKLEEVKIVKPAIEPSDPINPPKIGTNTVLGTVLGLILGVVFAFLIETFDTSIGAIEEVEDFLGVHVLGVIPFVSVEEIKTLLSDDPNADLSEEKVRRYARLAAHFVPSSTLSESYKALRTSLNFVCTENDLKTILFTSSSPGEGKTSIVVNIAITMAQIGQKVLLIDGDLRRPVISKLFGIEQIPGLTDVILGNYTWHNVVRSITDLMMGKLSIEDIMKTPGMDNLYIITSGTYAPNPAEIINSKAIGEFLNDIREEYDIILIDAPPVLAATDASLWSSRTDGTAIVYQVGKIARGALKRSKVSLENLKANVIGVVLNGLKAEISPDFGYQDYYYYYYGREKTPATLSERIKAKILTGPRNLFGSLFKKKTAELHEEEEPGDEGNSVDTQKELTAAIPAKLDDVQSQEPVKRQKKKPRGSSMLAGKSWLKIVIVALLIILLAVGLLYQAGFIKTQKMKQAVAPVRPPVAESLPQPLQETAPSQPVVSPAVALPSATEKQTPSTTALDSVKPFSVQIKAVPTAEEAKQIVESLKAKGDDAFSKSVLIKGRGEWHRIFVGRFTTKEEAQKSLKDLRLAEKYPGSIVQNTTAND